MKIIFTLSLLLLLASRHLTGQSEFSTETIFSQVRTLELRNMGSKSYSDIQGTPYFSDGFRESTVHFTDGNFATIPLRWDIFRDEMEFTKDNRIQWLIKKNVGYVRYGTDTLILANEGTDTTRSHYFILKNNGGIKLYYRKVVKFHPYVEPKGYTNSVPDRFLPDDDVIYIVQGKQAPVRIQTKKDLTELFSGNEAALDFIRSNKIKAEKIDDLRKLVSFLNKN